jgi:hypothetical protein
VSFKGEKMEQSDAMALISLLADYKRIWVQYQTLKFAHEHPESPNLSKMEEHSFETALDVFDPVFDALDAGQPIRGPLLIALQSLGRP